MTLSFVTLEVAGLAVAVPVPGGAEFSDLEGLPEGEASASWSPGPGQGAFMVSTGTGSGHTADGLVAGERERSDAVEVLHDELVAGPAGPARRIVLRSRRRERRSWEQRDGKRPAEVPEHDVEEELAFLFADGPGGAWLRVGYRVPTDAPAGILALLRRMFDETQLQAA